MNLIEELNLTLRVQQRCGQTRLMLEGPNHSTVRFERPEELLRYLKALTEQSGLR